MSPTMKSGPALPPIALACAAPCARDLDHARRDVEADDARRPVVRSLECDVAGAAGKVDHPSPGAQPRLAHQPPLPRPIAAERQNDGDEVVAIGNGGKQRAHVAALLLSGERRMRSAGSGQRGAVPSESGDSPRRSRASARSAGGSDTGSGPTVLGTVNVDFRRLPRRGSARLARSTQESRRRAAALALRSCSTRRTRSPARRGMTGLAVSGASASMNVMPRATRSPPVARHRSRCSQR